MHLEMCALYFTSLLNKVPRVGLYETTRYGLVIYFITEIERKIYMIINIGVRYVLMNSVEFK